MAHLLVKFSVELGLQSDFLLFFNVFKRCGKFICPHYHVHVLLTGRHGSAISKIFVVEKIHNKYADGNIVNLLLKFWSIFLMQTFFTHSELSASILFGIHSFSPAGLYRLWLSTMVRLLHVAKCNFLLLFVQRFLSQIVQK